ncbi:hypothetical protein BgiBS90_031939, partial [Biomphalaria glabrata]
CERNESIGRNLFLEHGPENTCRRDFKAEVKQLGRVEEETRPEPSRLGKACGLPMPQTGARIEMRLHGV